MPQLETIEIETAENPTASVIWLHGLGADGHDFEPVVPYFRGNGLPGIRFIFPHAPRRPVTINQGMVMRAWYDIKGVNIDQKQDAEGIADSYEKVSELIEHEQSRGMATDRIVMAGFSQGGAVALHMGTRWPNKFAGIIALSSYLPLHETWEAERSEANQDTSIFIGHGNQDMVVPMQLGEMSHQLLERNGYSATFKTYTMPHSVCHEELQDIQGFLKAVLA